MATTTLGPLLPTLYEYYGTPTVGLGTNQPNFTLNNKNITIYSGSMHYFRFPPNQWRDRLQKLRAAGLNTVETYVPWNLHEARMNQFNFGQDNTDDMYQFLDLKHFLKMAQEEDLLAIVRPGPYICAEFEWGGLPSWLLREPDLQVRSSNTKFMYYVKRYFSVLLPLLAAMQFINGGPIVAFQIENEYGSVSAPDLDYMHQLVDIYRSNGIKELLVTSDLAYNGPVGTIPGLLFQTVNFGSDPIASFELLNLMQPGKPIMAMEFWTGWFDHWSESHHTVPNDTFALYYEDILAYGASVNLYMFHGGTNFMFLNGANLPNKNNDNDGGFAPTTTSYDYDAPLTEAGDYTDKYYIVKELIAKYNPIKTYTPDPPSLIQRTVYPKVMISEQLRLPEMLEENAHFLMSPTTDSMEDCNINDGAGQSYGYIIYELGLNLPENSTLTITGYIRDTIMVEVNDVLISKRLTSSEDLNGFGYWRLKNSSITLNTVALQNATIRLIVENWGRVNFGALYHQKKGLNENNEVLINEKAISKNLYWIIYPVEFKRRWNEQIRNSSSWEVVNNKLISGPALYKAVFTLEHDPNYPSFNDTYINMDGWSKGVVIVNGFVLGKYAVIGPQKSLYLPGMFLTVGENTILIFEHFKPADSVTFTTDLLFY